MNPIRVLFFAILIVSTSSALAQHPKIKGGFTDAPGRTPRASPAVDNGMIGFSDSYLPSNMPWELVEKGTYQSLLPANSFDVLIVPYQVSGYALDRSTRSLMFTQLSMAVRDAGVRVPDPYLVLRALGENRRKFNPDDVYEFAHKLGVKRVIWTYCGHDRKNAISFEFRAKEADSDGYFGGPFEYASDYFFGVPFSSNSPPIVAYQALLPRIVETLDYKPREPSAKQASRYDATVLPPAPSTMSADKSDPAKDAFTFLMFASLTPASAQRTRERFVEKAFLAVLPLAEDYPDYRLLRARIFMLMGYRPAALNALSKGSTEEEKALLGMLNGNLPQVAAATVNVRPILKRVLAELDLAAIAHEYGVDDKSTRTAALKRLALPGTAWPFFVARSLGDADSWSQFSNLPVKEMLDSEFPIQGFTAAGIVSGAAALADSAKMQGSIDFSAHNHIQQFIGKNASKWCCTNDIAHPSTQDYLDLLDAISFDNLARRVNFLNSIQGRPEDALADLGRLEAVYKGHPHFSLLRAQAESSAAGKSESATKAGLLRSAYVNAFDAFYNEQGQTADAASAFNLIQQLNRMDFGRVNNVYVGDIPFQSSYPCWEYANVDLELKNARVALENSTIDSQPVHVIGIQLSQQKKDAEFGEFLKSLEGRFVGNGDIGIMRGDVNFRLGNTGAAEIAYREVIKSQPAPWQPYMALTNLLYWEGRTDESAKVARSYPGFSPQSSEGPVAIANNAYQAGSIYFWNGEFDFARPLYGIAAKLATGANSSMAGEARLKLLDGDFMGALEKTYERATRYGTSDAYRDYLAFLYAMGYSKEAWDAFNALLPQLPKPQIWESALVGHRLAGSSERDIKEWASQDAMRNAGDQSSYAAKYLLRAAVTDRVPSELTAASIGQFDRPAWQIAHAYRYTVKDSSDGQKHYIVGPKAPEGNYLLPGLFERIEKVRVKSDLEYFAQAYRLLRTGDYDGGRAVLEEAATFYDLTQNSQGYMLAYLALAAAKSKNTTAVENILAGIQIKEQKMDYLLAKAAILGIGGKPEEAIALLKLGKSRRPYTETRALYSEYQYAEIIEWLYESTKDTRYRDLALDWARSCEKNQPWHAWAYAMDAKLSGKGPERNRAIAMAFYLDRNSERLKSVPKSEIDSAVKEFGPRNPFLRMKDQAAKKST